MRSGMRSWRDLGILHKLESRTRSKVPELLIVAEGRSGGATLRDRPPQGQKEANL